MFSFSDYMHNGCINMKRATYSFRVSKKSSLKLVSTWDRHYSVKDVVALEQVLKQGDNGMNGMQVDNTALGGTTHHRQVIVESIPHSSRGQGERPITDRSLWNQSHTAPGGTTHHRQVIVESIPHSSRGNDPSQTGHCGINPTQLQGERPITDRSLWNQSHTAPGGTTHHRQVIVESIPHSTRGNDQSQTGHCGINPMGNSSVTGVAFAHTIWHLGFSIWNIIFILFFLIMHGVNMMS